MRRHFHAILGITDILLWGVAATTAVAYPDLVARYEPLHRVTLAMAIMLGVAWLCMQHTPDTHPPPATDGPADSAYGEVMYRLGHAAHERPAPARPAVRRSLTWPRLGLLAAGVGSVLVLTAGAYVTVRADTTPRAPFAVRPGPVELGPPPEDVVRERFVDRKAREPQQAARPHPVQAAASTPRRGQPRPPSAAGQAPVSTRAAGQPHRCGVDARSPMRLHVGRLVCL